MSFILDALKKSESERQRQAGPALLEMRIIPPSRGLPTWAIAVGAVLVASVGLLGWLALRPHPASTPAPQARPSVAQAPSSIAQGELPRAAAIEPSRDAVAAPPVPARLPGVSPANGADAGDAIETNPPEGNAADNEPAVTPQSATQADAGNAAKIRNYAEVSGTVPELRLDLHVYSAESRRTLRVHQHAQGARGRRHARGRARAADHARWRGARVSWLRIPARPAVARGRK
jgi:general secretion pathway protein B